MVTSASSHRSVTTPQCLPVVAAPLRPAERLHYGLPARQFKESGRFGATCPRGVRDE
jgi:hypothetical protein